MVKFGDPVLKSKASPVAELRPRAAGRGRADDRDHARRDGRRPRRHPARRAAAPARLPGRSRRRADGAGQPGDRVALRGGRRSPRRAASACRGSRSTSSGRCTPGSAAATPRASRSRSRPPGLEARVLQHEIDHLDGVLILDRTTRDQRKGALRALREGGSYSPPAERRGRRRGRAARAAHRRVSDRLPRHLRLRRHRPAAAGRLRRTGRRWSSRRPTAARGRGRRELPPPPAAEAAAELGIELLQAEDVNAEAALERIARRRARGARRLRLRPADPRAAALRAPDAQRAPLAAAALARRGADRAGDHGRRPAHRRLRDAAHRGARLGPGRAARGGADRRRRGLRGALRDRLAGARRRAAGARPSTCAAGASSSSPSRTRRRRPTRRRSTRPSAGSTRPRPAAELAATVRALTPHIGAYLEPAGGERLGVRRARAVDVGVATGAVKAE